MLELVAGLPELLDLVHFLSRLRSLEMRDDQEVVNFAVALNDVAVVPQEHVDYRREEDDEREALEEIMPDCYDFF